MTGLKRRYHDWGDRRSLLQQKFFRIVFGDRIGAAIFFGSLCFFALYWRVGFFISDNYTIVNTLVNIFNGHLEVAQIRYGPSSGVTPGMQIHDGKLYGRNYGLVIFALPFLCLLELLSLVTDLRIALSGLWSLTLIIFFYYSGYVFNRYRTCIVVGSVTAWLLFLGNIVLATPLDTQLVPLIALQMSTMVATAFIGVFFYRLLHHTESKQQSALFGGLVVLASPIGFWASIPKRHILISLLALLAFYCFSRSRQYAKQEGYFRCLMYVFVGLSAWVFSFEAFVLLAVILPIDLLTARSNHPRQLMLIGSAFTLSLLPFFLTNTLITGNPLRPPLMLPSYEGGEMAIQVQNSGSATTVSTGVNTPQNGSRFGLLAAFFGSMASSISSILDRFISGFFLSGISILIENPTRVFHVFLRSGYGEYSARKASDGAINLSLLEAFPLVSLLLGLPVVVIDRIKKNGLFHWLQAPARKTDFLIITYVLILTLVYLPRLSLESMKAQITVRYLLPAMVGLLYFVCRTIRSTGIHQISSAASLAAFGSLLLIFLLGHGVVLSSQDMVTAEAMQFHALVVLIVALFAGTSILICEQAIDSVALRLFSISLPAAATTTFILLSGWYYFHSIGEFALPLIRVLSKLLTGI